MKIIKKCLAVFAVAVLLLESEVAVYADEKLPSGISEEMIGSRIAFITSVLFS